MLSRINEFRISSICPRALTDARRCLFILLGTSILLVIIASVVVVDHMRDTHDFQYEEGNSLVLYGGDIYSRMFSGAVAFTLIISLPTIIDIVLSQLYLHTWEDLQTPIEFVRLFMVTILFLPNVFIYFQVIPSAVIDLIMFCQYLCMFFALVYRIYTLSTIPQKKDTHIYPVQDLFVLSMIAMVTGFLYKLSTHEIIPGRGAWKAIYTTFLLLLQLITCTKLKPWFNFTWHISRVVKNHVLLTNKIAFSAVIFGIFICTAMTLIHVIAYPWEYIYFPQRTRAYIALEWFFCGVLLLWTSVRNFESRKAELATAVSKYYSVSMN